MFAKQDFKKRLEREARTTLTVGLLPAKNIHCKSSLVSSVGKYKRWWKMYKNWEESEIELEKFLDNIAKSRDCG